MKAVGIEVGVVVVVGVERRGSKGVAVMMGEQQKAQIVVILADSSTS